MLVVCVKKGFFFAIGATVKEQTDEVLKVLESSWLQKQIKLKI